VKLFLVGGTVRDHLLGFPTSNDVDFAVEAASFDEMRETLMSRGLRVWQERAEFVTLRGQMPLERMGDFGGLLSVKQGFNRSRVVVDADFTLCRAEAMYTDKRHPDVVTPASLFVDLARRDFTVNAVAVSEDGVWFDPFEGRADAASRILRMVGNPNLRLDEDPLRMLRAFRFAVTRGLTLNKRLEFMLNDPNVLVLLKTLPVERVRDEMFKAFKHDWLDAAQALSNELAGLGEAVRATFPDLWLSATLEDKD